MQSKRAQTKKKKRLRTNGHLDTFVAEQCQCGLDNEACTEQERFPTQMSLAGFPSSNHDKKDSILGRASLASKNFLHFFVSMSN